MANNRTIFFYHLLDQLPLQFCKEYMRKIGLRENEIQDELRNSSTQEGCFGLLVKWSNQMGRFQDQDETFLNQVLAEVVRGQERNEYCDDYLNRRGQDKMKKGRDLAWLLFSLIRSIQHDDYWTRTIEHEKLVIPDHVLTQNRSDINDGEERKYNNLLWWIRSKGLEGALETVVVGGLREAGVSLPPEYEQNQHPVGDEDVGDVEGAGQNEEGVLNRPVQVVDDHEDPNHHLDLR